MSKKTRWVLVIVLAALSAAVWWSGRRAAPAAASAAGGRLLPDVDLATVRAVARFAVWLRRTFDVRGATLGELAGPDFSWPDRSSGTRRRSTGDWG